MILPNPKDAVHKALMYRTLSAIADHYALAKVLSFKGGTCAAMLGWLDRFSVDLDFDYVGSNNDLPKVRKELEGVWDTLGLDIKDASKVGIQYFLKYPARQEQRNTLKVDALFPAPKSNEYQKIRFTEIDRILICQTKETMFANKLVALIDRFEKTEGIAGRDLYDIHHFFLQGFRYSPSVIEERRKTGVSKFFQQLEMFIEKNITITVIDQDLNSLLEPKKFQMIRKVLKQETLMLIRDEITRLKALKRK